MNDYYFELVKDKKLAKIEAFVNANVGGKPETVLDQVEDKLSKIEISDEAYNVLMDTFERYLTAHYRYAA